MQDACIDFSRAIADLEILAAAYPDEVIIPYDLSMLQLGEENCISDDKEKNENEQNIKFPLTFTLTLPDPQTIISISSEEKEKLQISNKHIGNSSNNDSFIIMELPKGYPTEACIRIQSFRCGKSELVTITKFHMEETVAAAQNAANECFESQSEAGLYVCQAAISTWEECIQNQYEKNKREITMEHLTLQTKYEREILEEGNGIEWMSTEGKDLIIDRKSTFQAHVTYVNSEIMVQRALRKLIGGSSKIQRATHNMYAYRFKQVTDKNKTIIIHDNDDDGEDAAGSKLAHLLEMRDDDCVLVVVSRWYGGIHLGPKRFAHIVNAARELLIKFNASGEKVRMEKTQLN